MIKFQIEMWQKQLTDEIGYDYKDGQSQQQVNNKSIVELDIEKVDYNFFKKDDNAQLATL